NLIQARLDDERSVSARQRELGRFASATEPGDDGESDLEVADLFSESPSLAPPARREPDPTRRIAAHHTRGVHRRLGMAGGEAKAHPTTPPPPPHRHELGGR